MMKNSTIILEYGKRFIKELFFWSVVVGILALLIFSYRKDAERSAQEDVVRTEEICPALLSISRSARDTLIVMKAEPLCNSFVLDNLK